ncbi:MAG TPA: glycosyltransferase [Thermoplasmata archaeon]|nr:glycosyltransferase [Thermoplasmata archaeon]
MEVGFFTDSYPPMRDGVAQVTGGLARQLVRLGHRVRVFAPHTVSGRPFEEVVEDGVTVERFRSLTVPLYSQYRWPLWPLSAVRAPRGAAEMDVLHVHSPGGLGSAGFLASRRFGRPLVGTFHTNIRAMRESFPSKFLVPEFFRVAWWWNLGLYWRCDVATAPSMAARDDLVESVRKPFRRAVEVVPNGIDLDRFVPHLAAPDWRARCGLESAPLVTYLGRLTVDKGVHRFLDAVAEASTETSLVAIVGGMGPEEANVRARLRDDPRLRGIVRYIGPVAESEKPALLGQSDVFVLPSTSDTSSVALLEAMACGAAVVGPAEGGASELVEDGLTGRRVPVREPGALTRTVVELVREPAVRQQIARRGQEYVRTEASLEMMARRFISLYEHLIEMRRSGGGRSPS